MVELADTLVLETSAARHGGSTPLLGTNFEIANCDSWPINSAAEFLFYTEGVEGSSPSSVTNVSVANEAMAGAIDVKDPIQRGRAVAGNNFIASWQNGDAAVF